MVATVAVRTASLLVVLGESQVIFESGWWVGEDAGAEWVEDLSNRLISFSFYLANLSGESADLLE
jgi:hypothetical protein